MRIGIRITLVLGLVFLWTATSPLQGLAATRDNLDTARTAFNRGRADDAMPPSMKRSARMPGMRPPGIFNVASIWPRRAGRMRLHHASVRYRLLPIAASTICGWDARTEKRPAGQNLSRRIRLRSWFIRNLKRQCPSTDITGRHWRTWVNIMWRLPKCWGAAMVKPKAWYCG